MSASSFCAFGSFGAGNPAASSSSRRLRASSGSSFNPSNRCASLAYFALAVFSTSFVSAAIFSVSSVIKFSWTQDAREAFMPSSNNSVSPFSMYFFASSTVGAEVLLLFLSSGVCPRLAICATSKQTTAPERIATVLTLMPPPFSSWSPLPSIPPMPARIRPGPRHNASPHGPNKVPCLVPTRPAHAPRRTIPRRSSQPARNQKSRCSTAPSVGQSSDPEFAQSLPRATWRSHDRCAAAPAISRAQSGLPRQSRQPDASLRQTSFGKFLLSPETLSILPQSTPPARPILWTGRTSLNPLFSSSPRRGLPAPLRR